MPGIARVARSLLGICTLGLSLASGGCGPDAEVASEATPASEPRQAAVADPNGSPSALSSSPPSAPPTASAAATPTGGATPSPAAPAGRDVRVNGERLAEEALARLERDHGLAIVDGAYWYDAASGAAGPIGGPTRAFVRPGLDLGGPLAVDASGGQTGVLVNGRELPAAELEALIALVGPLEPGRYFVDGAGNAGREGGPATVNLLVLASQASASGGGDGWYSDRVGAGGNESGGSGYVMGRDASGNVWGASY